MASTMGTSTASFKVKVAAQFRDFMNSTDPAIFSAFFLIGLINNVIYVIILSAALDLVGPDIPKGLVLLADDVPSLVAKVLIPYFIHRSSYTARVLTLAALSSGGIILVATTPNLAAGGSLTGKLVGIVLGSLSCGVGEATYLSLTHFYGQSSLAAWSSGTGAAGLVGAGFYFLFTSVLGVAVKTTLLVSAAMPGLMLVAFFGILPRQQIVSAGSDALYQPISQDGVSKDTGGSSDARASTSHDVSRISTSAPGSTERRTPSRSGKLALLASLFVPYILPLMLVYLAEYTINQGVAPTLLFPISETPFSQYRSFYPFYNLLYQTGVVVARSSIIFIRIRSIYVPSMLQLCNLALLLTQALTAWLPSVYLVFAIILWEGLLGGLVYVNTFASILEDVPAEDREFSLGASSVGTSGGICMAAVVGMSLEPRLCEWQVERGRGWCSIYDG